MARVGYRFPSRPAEERFWAYTAKAEEGCWEWLASRSPGGYGRFSVSGTQVVQAHRYAYELLVGPIPVGLFVDHLCRNRGCVNPAHLEPVTNRENLLRGVGLTAQNAAKTNCPKGHPYSPENTIHKDGSRVCRECHRLQSQAIHRERADQYNAARRHKRALTEALANR